MIAVLLILDAHLLDLATFGMALNRHDISGEYSLVAAPLIALMGIGGIVALKSGGAFALSLITLRVPKSTWLALAAGAGLIGAASNVSALML